MAALSQVPKLQFFKANGDPLVGGKLYTYAAGTTTPQASYTDTTQNTANTNPIILDTRGEASVWLDQILVYKFVLTDANDVLIWTVDYINGDLPLSDPTGSSQIGFIQAGAGAVARTAQAKMREVITSADFGNTRGTQNVGLGPTVFLCNSSGILNTAMGQNAMEQNTTGGCNTAFGSLALRSNLSGFLNVGIGWGALTSNTTGIRNIGIGGNALCTNITGCDNVAVGVSALRFNTGDGNTAVGRAVLVANTSGLGNTGVGFNALAANLTGVQKAAYGYEALFYNTTGEYNIAVGTYALYSSLTGCDNVAIGVSSLYNSLSANENVAIGRGSLFSTTISTGNVAVGHRALNLATCSYNTAVGWKTLENTSTGEDNVAVGTQALNANTTGNENVAVGRNALFANTTGCNNVALGAYAATNNTVGIGNTAVGDNALCVNTTGEYNSAFGINALLTTNYCNTTGLGFAAAVTGNDQVQLGNALTTTYAYGAVQNRSDIRDKADIRDITLGLDFIDALRPVDFKWDYRENYAPALLNLVEPVKPSDNASDEEKINYLVEKRSYDVKRDEWVEANRLANLTSDGSKKRNRFHHGLIAQEVKALLDAQGIDFGGFQDHKINGGDDVLSIGYEELIAPMIKAIQQLNEKVEKLTNA
jgi:hypothetical protein